MTRHAVMTGTYHGGHVCTLLKIGGRGGEWADFFMCNLVYRNVVIPVGTGHV